MVFLVLSSWGQTGQRHCSYQCTVKGVGKGKDIDAMPLAKVPHNRCDTAILENA